ncbi:MAG: hypothetical protein ACIAQZ_05910 [Sedimentisphaeraceae bacterium JB056]
MKNVGKFVVLGVFFFFMWSWVFGDDDVQNDREAERQRRITAAKMRRLAKKWALAKAEGDIDSFDKIIGPPRASYRISMDYQGEHNDLVVYFYDELPESMKDWPQYLNEPLRGMVVFTAADKERLIREAIEQRDETVARLVGTGKFRLKDTSDGLRWMETINGVGVFRQGVEKNANGLYDIYLLDDQGCICTKTNKEYLKTATGKRVVEHTQKVRHPAELKINMAYKSCEKKIERIKSGRESAELRFTKYNEPDWNTCRLLDYRPLRLERKDEYATIGLWWKLEKGFSERKVRDVLGEPAFEQINSEFSLYFYCDKKDIDLSDAPKLPKYTGMLFFERDAEQELVLFGWIEPDWCRIYAEEFEEAADDSEPEFIKPESIKPEDFMKSNEPQPTIAWVRSGQDATLTTGWTGIH